MYRGLLRGTRRTRRPALRGTHRQRDPRRPRGDRTALGFGRGAVEIVASFDCPNLHFSVVPVVSRDDRLARLAVLIRTTPGAAIVYAPTRGLVEGLARVLVEAGVAAAPYHAGMTTTERSDTLVRFLDDRIRVVVATCAFGMGIDKPGVKLVAHWTMPATPELYYQEAGRAGRTATPRAASSSITRAMWSCPGRQLDVTYPRERTLEVLWKTPELRSRHPPSVVAAADRLAAELRPDRGVVDWTRVRRRRREAEKRLAAMSNYALTRSCRRRVLMEWFGEKIVRCAGCDRCRPMGR